MRRGSKEPLDGRWPFRAPPCAFVSSGSWTFCYGRPTVALVTIAAIAGTIAPMRKAIATAIFALCVVANRPAQAVCINTCSMVLNPISVAPPLPACATVTLVGETCICEIQMTLANSCSTAFNAVDFSFYGCTPATPCRVIPSGENTAAEAIDGTGSKNWILHVENAGVDYALTISANVTAFDDNPNSCSLSRRMPANTNAAEGAIGIALLVGSAARSRRRPPVAYLQNRRPRALAR